MLLELLRHPFARVPRRTRSIIAFDYDSAFYVGLRMLDGVVDFETGERYDQPVRAESVGELLGGA